jgi:hypothetical protein
MLLDTPRGYKIDTIPVLVDLQKQSIEETEKLACEYLNTKQVYYDSTSHITPFKQG